MFKTERQFCWKVADTVQSGKELIYADDKEMFRSLMRLCNKKLTRLQHRNLSCQVSAPACADLLVEIIETASKS